MTTRIELHVEELLLQRKPCGPSHVCVGHPRRLICRQIGFALGAIVRQTYRQFRRSVVDSGALALAADAGQPGSATAGARSLAGVYPLRTHTREAGR
jgi:hypothetical protein